MAIGFALPFARSSGSAGYFQETHTSLEATTQNIKSLLLTNWGERPMMYNFGCNFKGFLFENMDQDIRQKIADRILEQMGMWLPFVIVNELNVLLYEDDNNIPQNGIGVRMKFMLDGSADFSSRLSIIVPG